MQFLVGLDGLIHLNWMSGTDCTECNPILRKKELIGLNQQVKHQECGRIEAASFLVLTLMTKEMQSLLMLKNISHLRKLCIRIGSLSIKDTIDKSRMFTFMLNSRQRKFMLMFHAITLFQTNSSFNLVLMIRILVGMV